MNNIFSYKSKIVIGNLTIMNTKKFNKFRKLMYKFFFDAEIIDLERVNGE